MKRIRFNTWAAHLQIQPPRNPRIHAPSALSSAHATRRQTSHDVQEQLPCQRRHASSRRTASSAAAAPALPPAPSSLRDGETSLPHDRPLLHAPSHRKAAHSAKLAALHARLALPPQLPLQTLGRCLVDASADPRPGYHNAPLAMLGQDLLGYYTTEWLMCRWPRLPMSVLFAAQYAYVGPATLGAMRAEWGVEVAAAPGSEVEPGLLQLKRTLAGNAILGEDGRSNVMPGARRLGASGRRQEEHWRQGVSARIVHHDQFGDTHLGLPPSDSAPYPGAATTTPAEAGQASSAALVSSSPAETDATSVEAASASFIRALTGALYLHAGASSVKQFHKDHILSRQLPLHTLFHFTHPTRDLSRLCARQGFEPPVARLISETGRLSRTPVYVVGVYSGDSKLGEAAGASLNEGRVRAAAAALRAWYLYSPAESEVVLPSEVEGGKGKKGWKPQLVDVGEVVT